MKIKRIQGPLLAVIACAICFGLLDAAPNEKQTLSAESDAMQNSTLTWIE